MKITQTATDIHRMLKKFIIDYRINHDETKIRLRRIELGMDEMYSTLNALEKENKRLTRLIMQAYAIKSAPVDETIDVIKL